MSHLKLMNFGLPCGNETRQLKFAFNLDRGNHKTVHNFLSAGQLYEPDIGHFLRRVMKPGDRGIDVGANLGFHSILMSALVGPEGSVDAFEPDAINIRDFKTNQQLNNANNITLHEVALSTNASGLQMISSHEDGGWNTVMTGADSKFVASIDREKNDFVDGVRTETLDGACTAGCYRVAKLDVEGYEGVVLDSGKELLKSGAVDYWVVEYAAHCLAHFGEDQWSIRRRFLEHGYDCFVLSRIINFPMYVPRETTIVVPTIINLLFAKPESLARDFKEQEFGLFVFGNK